MVVLSETTIKTHYLQSNHNILTLHFCTGEITWDPGMQTPCTNLILEYFRNVNSGTVWIWLNQIKNVVPRLSPDITCRDKYLRSQLFLLLASFLIIWFVYLLINSFISSFINFLYLFHNFWFANFLWTYLFNNFIIYLYYKMLS